MKCRFKGIPVDESLSENAQVLLVEDNTIKRAPLKKVGGGSGEREYELKGTFDVENNIFTLTDESLEFLIDCFSNYKTDEKVLYLYVPPEVNEVGLTKFTLSDVSGGYNGMKLGFSHFGVKNNGVVKSSLLNITLGDSAECSYTFETFLLTTTE